MNLAASTKYDFRLDHDGPVPIYEQIQGWMQEQIVNGVWPERYKLPSEADVAAELEVSRGTVRKAIGDLAAKGLLVRTHGRGTFVAPKALEQPLADEMVTFSEDLISRGIPFQTSVVEQGIVPADRRVAARLRLQPGRPVFVLKRLRMVNDTPLILLHNYVVKDVCPGIEKMDFAHVRLFELLEDHYGLQIDHGRRNRLLYARVLGRGDALARRQQQRRGKLLRQRLRVDVTAVSYTHLTLPTSDLV